MPWEGHTLRFTLCAGTGSASARILLLSSPFAEGRELLRLGRGLAESGCDCLVCDFPDAACPHSRRLAEFLWPVLDACAGAGRVWHLFAHGLSARTALEMADIRPDGAASLMLLAPFIEPPALLKKPRRGMKAAEFLLLTDPGRFLLSVLLPATVRLPRRIPGLMEMVNYRPHPAPAMIPKLVFWCGSDELLGSRVPASLARLLPDSEIHLLAGASHLPLPRMRVAVLDYVRGWLATS